MRIEVGRVGAVALTVHGSMGAVDLVVPAAACVDDVAREYAAQCRLPSSPALHRRTGAELARDLSLSEVGVRTGDLLVAAGPVGGLALDAGPAPRAAPPPGAMAVAWFATAVSMAVLAGCTAHAGGADRVEGRVTVALLAVAALLGVLPVGRLRAHRMVAAPAFAGAAAYAVVWVPGPERLPTVVGASALAAAITAATARAVDVCSDEALQVWTVAGVSVFVATGVAALLHASPQLVWGGLVVVATLAARFVPAFAVGVPDQVLIDLERLAVTAWSARERPAGRRGRAVVSSAAVAQVAARGSRIVTAWAAAIWAVTAIAGPMVLATAVPPVDRLGAWVMVAMAGFALLLAARSYRHRAGRSMLCGAGLTCLAVVVVVLLERLGPSGALALALAAIVVALVLVVVAVAIGRGWRSTWWSRLAEVAEGLAGALLIASLVVASGMFRSLWETAFRV